MIDVPNRYSPSSICESAKLMVFSEALRRLNDCYGFSTVEDDIGLN